MTSSSFGTDSVAGTRRQLLGVLAALGGSSVAAGTALMVRERQQRSLWDLLRRTRRSDVRWAFGRQCVAWGSVNLALAGVGAVRERRAERRFDEADEAEQARKLRRLLLVNCALDVGYVAIGAGLIAGADALGRRGARYSADLARGDGAGIVVQGTLLLALDTAFALRLREEG